MRKPCPDSLVCPKRVGRYACWLWYGGTQCSPGIYLTLLSVDAIPESAQSRDRETVSAAVSNGQQVVHGEHTRRWRARRTTATRAPYQANRRGHRAQKRIS